MENTMEFGSGHQEQFSVEEALLAVEFPPTDIVIFDIACMFNASFWQLLLTKRVSGGQLVLTGRGYCGKMHDVAFSAEGATLTPKSFNFDQLFENTKSIGFSDNFCDYMDSVKISPVSGDFVCIADTATEFAFIFFSERNAFARVGRTFSSITFLSATDLRDWDGGAYENVAIPYESLIRSSADVIRALR